MGTRGRMEVWGSADIRTITHQQALKSLEETLIATKLTRIEFPRKARHRRWSSWMIDGAIAGWGPAVTWVSLLLVLSSMISNLLSRLSPSRSRCTPTVHMAQFTVVILSTIYRVTNHQPPSCRAITKGRPKKSAWKKESKEPKKKHPCLWTVQHNSPKTGKLEPFSSLANSYLSEQKEGGQSNCRIQISCDRFFHLRSHQSNFSGLPSRRPPSSHPFVPAA